MSRTNPQTVSCCLIGGLIAATSAAGQTTAQSNDTSAERTGHQAGQRIAFRLGAEDDDYGKDLSVDREGNIVVTGCFSGTVDFDPGPGTSQHTSHGSFDVFVAKYDRQGNYLWSISVGGRSIENRTS